MRTVQINCKECGIAYLAKECKKDISKYCSIKCKSVYASKKFVPWNKGKNKKEFPQLSNSGRKAGHIPWNKGKKLPGMSRENHPLWISDRSKLAKRQERNDSAYKQWRYSVWSRDGFKCKMLNEDCNGRIEAHHILGWTEHPELRYQTNNGITLCHAHHPRKRAEEKRLSPYFKDLVSVSKKK